MKTEEIANLPLISGAWICKNLLKDLLCHRHLSADDACNSHIQRVNQAAALRSLKTDDGSWRSLIVLSVILHTINL